VKDAVQLGNDQGGASAPDADVLPRNAGRLFARHVADDRVALVDISDPDAPVEIGFRRLDAVCDAVARGLVRVGLGAGDRVGVLAANRWDFVAFLFGAMRAGVVPVPVNLRLPDETVHRILAAAGVRAVVVDGTSRDRVGPDQLLIDFDDEYDGFLDIGPFAAIEPDPATVAVQPYTSGSTGQPKGVMLGHRGIVWVTSAAVWMRGMGADTCTMVAAPLFHKNALQAIKQGLFAGGRTVLMRRFEPAAYVDAIGRYGATLLTGVPTMFAMMLRESAALSAAATSTVRRVAFGSAPASDALFDRLLEAFPNAVVENNYGITEGGPIMFGPHPAGLPRPRNAVGYPMVGVEVRLVGGATPDEGTLQVKSPGVMIGYHGMPDATAARVKDGWFDTGDVLRRDADGFYYFVGRDDDMFVCSGENIFPSEVETVLERHPAVAQAVVVPVADELKGQAPHAFVVLNTGADADEPALQAYARANGPIYAYPRRVHFLAALPLTGANKIDRAKLTKEAAARANGGTPT